MVYALRDDKAGPSSRSLPTRILMSDAPRIGPRGNISPPAGFSAKQSANLIEGLHKSAQRRLKQGMQFANTGEIRSLQGAPRP